MTDVAQEKQHNALLQGVEQFQPSSLKKTETVEKNLLPNAIGIVWVKITRHGFNLVSPGAEMCDRFVLYTFILIFSR